MNIDRVLAGLPDDDDDPVPMIPRADNLVVLDDAFESADYGLEEDAEVIFMHLPKGKVARVSKRQMQACTTSQQLRELDSQLYRSAGLDPKAYGL
jgi:hypothetical protein